MMYAIVEIGGEQHRVSEGDLIKVEKLNGEVGQRIEFKDVLLLCRQGEVTIGRPNIEQAKVIAEVVRHGKGKKIIVFTYRRRKDSKRKLGHRQGFTELRILQILTADERRNVIARSDSDEAIHAEKDEIASLRSQ